MPFVGYSDVADLALTYPALAEGVGAVAIEGQGAGQGVGGSEVIWRPIPSTKYSYILMEDSGEIVSYVLDELEEPIYTEIQ